MEENKDKKEENTVYKTLEDVCEDICDHYCKYKAMMDEDDNCGHMENCPLNRLV